MDLRVVHEDEFGAALQYFTGNKGHNIRLRELAIKKGMVTMYQSGLIDVVIGNTTLEEVLRVVEEDEQ